MKSQHILYMSVWLVQASCFISAALMCSAHYHVFAIEVTMAHD